jgi:dTDP-4-dehydrorhamnose 3,5-epimerase
MIVEATGLPEVLLITPRTFPDSRGEFFVSWRADAYTELGISESFVQDNVSISHAGVLRGLHMQWPNNPQGKLVSALSGEVFDVAVDLRRGSPTFSKWVGFHLTSQNKRQLWIPPGFAHGFIALSESVVFAYKVTAPYSAADEITVAWNDPQIGIRWPVEQPATSERDASAPPLRALDHSRLPAF